MQMRKRYGIFENEVDDLIERVRAHDSLAAIESDRCPCCSAALRVFFWPDGGGFCIQCVGVPPHLSPYQEISSLPPWWRERIGQVTEWLTS